MKPSKHLFVLIAGGAIFALTSFHPVGTRSKGPRPSQRQAIRTIIIDPGHGGFDYGTSGLFSREKDVALAISNKLGQLINEAFPDIKIVYTRTTDVLPSVGADPPAGYAHHAGIAAGLNYR